MTKRKTHEEFSKEFYDLSNKKYELLSEYITNKKKVKVRHLECNHVYDVLPTKFLSGQRCPNCKGKRISKSRTLTQKEFEHKLNKTHNGEITAIDKYEGKRNKITFKHEVCGKTFVAQAGNVVYGSSCPHCYGHKNTQLFKQQCNQLYGDEYSIVGDYKNNRIKVLVRHNKCNHEWEVIPKDLLNGHGCPNCQSSKGEDYIRKWLTDNKIEFIEQYRFKDCRYKLPLPFDFMVNVEGQKYLIEFDGEQHFGKRNYWGRENAREEIKRNDRIKNDYCAKNNIPLLRIPYWHLRTDRIDRDLNEFLQLTKGSTTSHE